MPQNRITALNLSWKDIFLVNPRADFKRATGSKLTIDGVFDREVLARGQGYESLGEYSWPLMPIPNSGHDNMECFVHGLVIKEPGSEQHRLPSQLHYLENLIEQVASHQFVVSSEAKNKICFLTLRSLDLKPHEPQIAQDQWHTHKVPTRQNMIERMRHLEIASSSLSLVEKLDTNAVQSEYMVSDSVGSLIQTKSACKKLVIEESEHSFGIERPDFRHRQAGDYEIVFGNSYTFHAAAQPKLADFGQRRTFALITYAPVLGM